MPIKDKLDQWTQIGGRLRDFFDYDDRLTSIEDVDSLAEALRQLHNRKVPNADADALHDLVKMLQELRAEQGVTSEELFNTVKSVALPKLRPFLQEVIANKYEWNEDGVMLALKVIAIYGDASDLALLLSAINSAIHPGHYLWQIVLSCLSPDNARLLLERLGDSLPHGLIGVCILDLANSLTANEIIDKHPFDSDKGIGRLANYIHSRNAKEFTFAGSAVMAIPFLKAHRRDELIELACQHPEFQVRAGAAWAGAKVGQEGSIEQLIDLASDINSHHLACRYLEHLALQDRIPTETKTPEFQAKAELASWLAHPNEMGKHPDSIEVVDHRAIYWPPTEDERDVWLLRYSGIDADDELRSGVGMVGSITFALFGVVTDDMAANDIYVEHCAWELRKTNPDVRSRLQNDNRDEARQLLQKHNESFD